MENGPNRRSSPQKRDGHRSARPQDTAPLVDQDTVDQLPPAASAEPNASIADDMPDIIDVILEMGRAPEEPLAEAEVPSPRLPVVSTLRLPAHLDALADRARDYVEAVSSAAARLRFGLEAVCELVPTAGRRDVSARSAGRWPLHHRLRFGKGDWRQEAELRVNLTKARGL